MSIERETFVSPARRAPSTSTIGRCVVATTAPRSRRQDVRSSICPRASRNRSRRWQRSPGWSKPSVPPSARRCRRRLQVPARQPERVQVALRDDARLRGEQAATDPGSRLLEHLGPVPRGPGRSWSMGRGCWPRGPTPHALGRPRRLRACRPHATSRQRRVPDHLLRRHPRHRRPRPHGRRRPAKPGPPRVRGYPCSPHWSSNPLSNVDTVDLRPPLSATAAHSAALVSRHPTSGRHRRLAGDGEASGTERRSARARRP